MTAIECVHTVGSLSPGTGGPSRSVPALCAALQAAGANVHLLAASGSPADLEPLPASLRLRTSIASHHGRPGFRRLLATTLASLSAAAVHDHGIWLPTNHLAARQARRLGRPRIVSVRGMLDPASRGHRSWRKNLAWLFYQRRDLESAAVLHSTSEREARHLRAAGLEQPIAIIPNGIALPPVPARHQRRPRTALFLGRLHPIKGLPRWIEAWAAVRPAGWRMVIAGPDHRGHRSTLEGAVAGAGLAGDCHFTGELDERRKQAALEQAELLVLPSDGESFGMAVAEALASGLPVITTHGTPWREVEQRGCGWWVEPTAESLAEALAVAATLDRGELAAMGARGRQLIEERYSWPALARRMLAVYAWVLGVRAEPPDSVWRAGDDRGTGSPARGGAGRP